MYRVADLMTRDVLSFQGDTPLLAAARALCHRQVGAGPVCAPDGRVIGVLSKSDIADLFGLPSEGLRVSDVMTPEVIAVSARDSLDAAIRAMAFEGVHRLVVIDSAGRLVGILSATDVLRQLSPFAKGAPRVLAVAPPAGSDPRGRKHGTRAALRTSKRRTS